MDLHSKLAALSDRCKDNGEWRPARFDLRLPDDRDALGGLVDAGRVTAVFDTLTAQLQELMATRTPSKRNSPADLERMAHEHLAGRSLQEYGVWVFFPWSGKLVHLLPEGEFCELRTARNHYKITREEQAILATKRVGVVGLSVGQASAVTMAQEGVGRSFRLADFDLLALSNMNRLRASVTSLGLHKGVIAAREMYEIDPYLDIDVYLEGLTEDNVDSFVSGRGPSPALLDLVVEECDDLFAKILVRERAKARGIPVIMDTNDRGMLDIERFDLDPDLPILHGLVRDVRASDVKSLATRDKLPYVLAILGQDGFSDRFVPSLMEIDYTTASWPQLASGVMLGAALVTDPARRIFLGQLRESGRYFVDLDELVRDDRRAPLDPPAALDTVVSELALAAPSLELPRVQREITRDDIRRLVEHGTFAASGGNVQPWRFVARGREVRCYVDESRTKTLLDFDRTGTHVAIGAAVENIDLAARAAGLSCEARPFPDPRDPDLVCTLSLAVASTPPEVPPLARHISARVTNRRMGRRAPLSAEQLGALHASIEGAGAHLQVLTDPEKLDAVGALLGRGDRVRFLSKQLHHEMMGELRWSLEEVERTRDGIDLATLEFSRTDYAALRLSRSYANLRFLLKIRGGRALEKPARDAVSSSSAIGLLTVQGAGRESYLRGGRAMQRLWLAATALGLAFQPWTAILYLWSRLERGGGEGLEEEQVPVLRQLRAEFSELFRVAPEAEAEIMLFRLSHAGPPSARSLRRPVEDVLRFDDG